MSSRASTRATIMVVLFVLLSGLLVTGTANAVSKRKVTSYGSAANAVAAQFKKDRKVSPAEGKNKCLTSLAISHAKSSAQKGKWGKTNRAGWAKKCKVSHVYIVRVSKKNVKSKSQIVKTARKHAEYRKAIKSANRWYGAGVYRDKKTKRAWTVMLAGRPIVKPKPAPAPKPTPKPTQPTATPTTVPTTVPTTQPTTEPTTAPTTAPTTEPTAPALPPAPSAQQVQDSLRTVVNDNHGDVLSPTLPACFENITTAPATFAELECGPYGFVSTAVVDKPIVGTVDSMTTTVADTLMGGLDLSKKHPETNPYTGLTGSRSLADVSAQRGDRAWVKVTATPDRDGYYRAALVVTFGQPVYTNPKVNPQTSTILNAVVARAGGGTVRNPVACVTDDIDERAKSMGMTEHGGPWSGANLNCPDMFEQFVTGTTVEAKDASDTAEIVSRLTTGDLTGVVNGSGNRDSMTRVKQALRSDSTEASIAVRSYVDYRGRVHTSMAVVFDDYPYAAPVRATDVEAELKAELLDRAGATSWPSVDPCMESKVAEWAESIAASKAKGKDYYDDWKKYNTPERIDGINYDLYNGGMDETFVSSGCAGSYVEGYVIATKSSMATAIADEIHKAPTFTLVGKKAYSRGWAARTTVNRTITRGNPISIASYRDFRGDVWTYLIGVYYVTESPAMGRLTPHQIEVAEAEVVNLINTYRASLDGGIPALSNSSCVRDATLGSIMFAGTYRHSGGSFYFADIEHRDPNNKQVDEVFARCNVKSAAEIMTTSSGKINDGSDQFARELAARFVQNWKDSPSHDPYLRGKDATRIGIEVRNSDRAGYYVATASVTD